MYLHSYRAIKQCYHTIEHFERPLHFKCEIDMSCEQENSNIAWLLYHRLCPSKNSQQDLIRVLP